MPSLWHVQATWSGGKIGTGFTNFYFSEGVSTAVQASDAARAFLNSCYTLGGKLPTGITINFRAAVDVIDANNGELQNTIPVTQPASVVGSDNSAHAAVAGACVTWRTDSLVDGKRVRGRTFLVPMGGLGLQSDGTIDNTTVGSINTAAGVLISAAPEFVVWHRPASKAAGGGSAAPVVAGVCVDKTAYLTSRR